MQRKPLPATQFVYVLKMIILFGVAAGALIVVGQVPEQALAADAQSKSDNPASPIRSPGDELAVPDRPRDKSEGKKKPAESKTADKPSESPKPAKPKQTPAKPSTKPDSKGAEPESSKTAPEPPRRPQVPSLPPPEPTYQRAELPPLLEFEDGKPLAGAVDWPKRRREISLAMQTYFVGTFPDAVPQILGAQHVDVALRDDGSRRERIALTLNTPGSLNMEICLWTPAGEGPFPVLLTPPRYYQLAWAEAAHRRGYLVCLYPGIDSHHREDDYPGYESLWETVRAEYPEATWSEMAIKAWLASRALDYLLDPTSATNADEEKIGITGFSRYGKQALIAAAFDARIDCVLARSPGAPGSCPYRFTSRHTFGESPEVFPGAWFLPSLRSYEGREEQLPIDAHGWLALIAPRWCILDTAYNDFGESTFAVERACREAQKVYRMLGHPERLRIDYREGQHTPVTEEHIERNLDCLDRALGRGESVSGELPSEEPITGDTESAEADSEGLGERASNGAFGPEELVHTFDWDVWKGTQPAESLKPPFEGAEAVDDEERIARILWALGDEPEQIVSDEQPRFYTPEESELMWHDVGRPEDVVRVPVAFGEGVRGNIYYNRSVTEPMPVVIWLHPYSYPSGYSETWAVNRGQFLPIYQRLAAEGLVVLAYDQCGFGLRLHEGSAFYQDFPHWSLLGRMVHDLRSAVDLLVEGRGTAAQPLPPVDTERIYALGYALGGTVGLYGTALDDRIAGVASFCGFTPLRTDTDAKPTGGIRRLWQWHALQPRLGLFQGREAEIPYDYDDVLRLIAPRPCLVVSPTRDRLADCNDVVACVERAREAWVAEGASLALVHMVPDDTNRFELQQHETFLHWLRNIPKAGDQTDGEQGETLPMPEALPAFEEDEPANAKP